MINICTSFDDKYFEYGYALICSVLNNGYNSVFVYSLNLSKKQLLKLQKLNIVIKNEIILKNTLYEGMRSKTKSIDFTMQSLPDNEKILYIDADSILQSNLDAFEPYFDNYDFGVIIRHGAKDHLKILANNLFFKNSSVTRDMIKHWLDIMPNWKPNPDQTNKNSDYSGYAEQACGYLSYEKFKDSIKLIDLNSIDLPIFHAKGSKFSFHKDYKLYNYDDMRKNAISKYFDNK